MRLRSLAIAAVFSVVVLLSVFSTLERTHAGAQYDALEAFVGTWMAKNQSGSTRFVILKLHESGGRLLGTINHSKFRVGRDDGRITGNGEMLGEVPISIGSVSNGDFGFRLGANPPFPRGEGKFVLEGTRVAHLMFPFSEEQRRSLMTESRANAFYPDFEVSREQEDVVGKLLGGDRDTAQSPASRRWEVQFSARFINTAEAEHRFTSGRYADYLTLLHSGEIEQTGRREFTWLPGNLRSGGRGPETEPLPGYSFRLLVSADTKSYQLSIREKTPGICAYGVFTDETGIISETLTVGCPSASR